MSTPARSQDVRRRRILEWAGRLFATRDYAEVTLEMIAAHASVARGTVYNHFGSKAGLYRQVLALKMGELLERLERVLRETADPEQNLRRCVVHPFLFFVKYPEMLLLRRRENLRWLSRWAANGARAGGTHGAASGNGPAHGASAPAGRPASAPGARRASAPAGRNGADSHADLDPHLSSQRRRLVELVRGVLCAGIQSGSFRSVDPETTAHIVLGAIEATAESLAGEPIAASSVRKAKEELYQLIAVSLHARPGWIQEISPRIGAACAPRCLRGARIALTRREEESALLAERIRRLGGRVVSIPMLRIAPPADPGPLREARRRIASFDWVVLTSRHAARALLEGLDVPVGARPRIAAVGKATADVVRSCGWPLDHVATGGGAAALAESLVEREPLAGCSVLYPCSNLAWDDLPRRLQAAGAALDCVEAYRTEPPRAEELRAAAALGPGGIDIAVFASPSAVAHFAVCLPRGEEILAAAACVAIGARTAQALRDAGARTVLEAPRPDDGGLLEAILGAWEARTGEN